MIYLTKASKMVYVTNMLNISYSNKSNLQQLAPAATPEVGNDNQQPNQEGSWQARRGPHQRWRSGINTLLFFIRTSNFFFWASMLLFITHFEPQIVLNMFLFFFSISSLMNKNIFSNLSLNVLTIKGGSRRAKKKLVRCWGWWRRLPNWGGQD